MMQTITKEQIGHRLITTRPPFDMSYQEVTVLEFSPNGLFVKLRLDGANRTLNEFWFPVKEYRVWDDLGPASIQLGEFNKNLVKWSIGSPSIPSSIVAEPISVPTVFWGNYPSYTFTCNSHASS